MASYPWHWDFFFDKYPYTDFHELNLDWLIHAMKYWYKNVDYVRQAIATGSEDGNKYYETGHSAGDLIWWRGEFYRLTKDVSAGDDIDCNSLEHISVEDLLDEEEAARKAADTALGQRIDKEITDRTNADAGLQTQITSNDSDIADLYSKLSAETSNRESADSNLQTQITSNDADIAELKSCCETVQSDISGLKTTDQNLQRQISGNDTDIAALQAAVQTAQNTASAAQTAASAVTGTAPNTSIYNISGTEIVGKVSSFSFASVKTNIDATSHRGLLFTVAEAYHMLGFSESGDPSRLGVYVYNGDYNAYASNLYAGLDASDASYYVYAETPVSGTAPVRADVLLTYYSGDGVYIDRTT